MSRPLDRLRERLARKAAARRQTAPEQASAEPSASAAVPESRSPPAERAAPAQPRLVRRVVWAYEVGVLPVPWLMGYKRLKATLERAGFAIRVDMLPLTGLPDDVDLLFVPDELAETARQAAPSVQVTALEGRPEQTVFQALVDQLRAGTALAAPSAPPATSIPAAEEHGGAPPEAPRGTIVRYRGFERID